MHQNSQVDIKVSRSSCGLQKVWPTLVLVHIATEVLETLHPLATGLCWSGMYIINVWLMTLITFASPQQGDLNFLGGVCMHYNIDHGINWP